MKNTFARFDLLVSLSPSATKMHLSPSSICHSPFSDFPTERSNKPAPIERAFLRIPYTSFACVPSRARQIGGKFVLIFHYNADGRMLLMADYANPIVPLRARAFLPQISLEHRCTIKKREIKFAFHIYVFIRQ
jgi:hypothetical protein